MYPAASIAAAAAGTTATVSAPTAPFAATSTVSAPINSYRFVTPFVAPRNAPATGQGKPAVTNAFSII